MTYYGGNRNYGGYCGNRYYGGYGGNRNGGYGGNRNYGNYGGKQGGYSAAEKKSFYSGQGYKLGKSGKAIDFKNPRRREAFMAGYKSIDPNHYPDAKSGRH